MKRRHKLVYRLFLFNSGIWRRTVTSCTAADRAVQFLGAAAVGSCAVGVGSVRNIQDDYRVAVLVDPVTHSPVRSPAGGILPGVFVTQRVADTARVVQQRAGDELCRGRGDLLWQPGDLALRPGRTSSFHRPAGPVTQRRRQGTGVQSGGGTLPRLGRGHPPLPSALHRRQRARLHPAATTRLTRPTPVLPAAATPRQTPARRAGARDARQRPAHDRPLPLRRPRPAGRHRRAARRSCHPVCSRQPADRASHTGGHQEAIGNIRAGFSCPRALANRTATARLPGGNVIQPWPPEP